MSLIIFSSIPFLDLIKRQLDNRFAVLTSQPNPISQITARNLTAGIAPEESVGQLVDRQNIGYTPKLGNQNVEYNPGYANQSYDPTGQLNQNIPTFAQSDSPGTSIVHHNRGKKN